MKTIYNAHIKLRVPAGSKSTLIPCSIPSKLASVKLLAQTYDLNVVGLSTGVLGEVQYDSFVVDLNTHQDVEKALRDSIALLMCLNPQRVEKLAFEVMVGSEKFLLVLATGSYKLAIVDDTAEIGQPQMFSSAHQIAFTLTRQLRVVS